MSPVFEEPTVAGERALWFYTRGAARMALGQHDGIADLRESLSGGAKRLGAGPYAPRPRQGRVTGGRHQDRACGGRRGRPGTVGEPRIRPVVDDAKLTASSRSRARRVLDTKLTEFAEKVQRGEKRSHARRRSIEAGASLTHLRVPLGSLLIAAMDRLGYGVDWLHEHAAVSPPPWLRHWPASERFAPATQLKFGCRTAPVTGSKSTGWSGRRWCRRQVSDTNVPI